MTSNFQLLSIDPAGFTPLFLLTDQELDNRQMKRVRADKDRGFPCRISLEDARKGEELILFSFHHHAVSSPYNTSGPIYIRKNAVQAYPGINEIPSMFLSRIISVRPYDAQGMMRAPEVCEGTALKETLGRILDNNLIQYIHLHFANAGCYACKVVRR